MAESKNSTLGKLRYTSSWQVENKKESPDQKNLSRDKQASRESALDPAASDTESPSKVASGNTGQSGDEYDLPLWIKQKDYSNLSPSDADKQLWEDIESAGIEEEGFVKYIWFDQEGKAQVDMPSDYHEHIGSSFADFLSEASTDNDPLKATSFGSMGLTNGSQKQPDVFIFGTGRLQQGRNGTWKKGSARSNPHAIIEVSWTNKILKDKEKFALQLTNHKRDRGRINVGYLVKFIPTVVNQLPTEEHPDRPLWGIDVYRMESPEDDEAYVATEPPLYCTWRHGEVFEERHHIAFTADELERQSPVSIPLEWIVEDLKNDLGVVFQSREDA